MSVLCKSIKPHKSQINSIRQIQVEPFDLITTSDDKMVKIIDMMGRIKCQINLLQTSGQLASVWNFGYDFSAARKDELEKVARIV